MKTKIIPIASSSSGNSTLIQTESENILIDFGISSRRMIKALDNFDISPQDIDGIIISHEHGDHIRGLDVFCKNFQTKVYLPQEIADMNFTFLEKAKIVLYSHFRTFSIGHTGIIPFEIPHDSQIHSGFRIETRETEIGYATDIGYLTPIIYDHMAHADILFIEANYDKKMLQNGHYPHHVKKRIMGNGGHISNTECRTLLEKVSHPKLRRVILAHLSEQNNIPALAKKSLQGLNFPIEVAPVLHSCL